MFGSVDKQAKLVASNIILNGDRNSIWLSSPDAGELGADINVTGDFTLAGQTSSSLLLAGDSQLSVGNNLYLDTTNGSLLITNNGGGNGITVGGDLTIINNNQLNDVNSVNNDAGIFSTQVSVGGDLNIIGKNVGETALQLLNAAGNGVTVSGDINVSSDVSGNVTNFAVGHFSKLTAGENINLNSVSGGSANLLIGNTAYGAPSILKAKQILMSGLGENIVAFYNNKLPSPGQDGYVFDVPINGNGAP